MTAESSGAVCALHSDQPATATCRRCGRFCCQPCGSQLGTCPSCVAREELGTASALAIAAGLTGMFSLLCGFAPGLVAIVLAQIELGRIARGESSRAGRGWANAGQLLGTTALALGAIIALALW